MMTTDQFESPLYKLTQNGFAIGKIMIGGLMAHAGPARDFPHAESRNIAFFQQVEAGFQDLVFEIFLHERFLSVLDTVKIIN